MKACTHTGKPSKTFSPPLKNASQKLAWRQWTDVDLMFLVGPAGTGKTHAASVLAMREIHAQRASKIVLVRPAVEASGEQLGFLPGEVGDKLGPYLRPVKDELEKICAMTSQTMPLIENVPLAYMRGRNFDDCVVIVDEAQNLNRSQFTLVCSRMCVNAKMVISGDPMQSDIGTESFLVRAIESSRDIPRVAAVEFAESENVRHGLVPQLIRAFSAPEND
jgi:phosphate starvation-inducible PhoH-like protein